MGRNYNRGGSNGGRGRGRGRGNYRTNSGSNSSRSSSSRQQLELKFAPNTQGRPTHATYATIKDVIVQQIQKTYECDYDIASSLDNMELYDIEADKPVRELTREIQTRPAPNKMDLIWCTKLN